MDSTISLALTWTKGFWIMREGGVRVRVKELRILVGSDFIQSWKLSLGKPYLCLVTHSYSGELVLRRIQYFIV